MDDILAEIALHQNDDRFLLPADRFTGAKHKYIELGVFKPTNRHYPVVSCPNCGATLDVEHKTDKGYRVVCSNCNNEEMFVTPEHIELMLFDPVVYSRLDKDGAFAEPAAPATPADEKPAPKDVPSANIPTRQLPDRNPNDPRIAQVIRILRMLEQHKLDGEWRFRQTCRMISRGADAEAESGEETPECSSWFALALGILCDNPKNGWDSWYTFSPREQTNIAEAFLPAAKSLVFWLDRNRMRDAYDNEIPYTGICFMEGADSILMDELGGYGDGPTIEKIKELLFEKNINSEVSFSTRFFDRIRRKMEADPELAEADAPVDPIDEEELSMFAEEMGRSTFEATHPGEDYDQFPPIQISQPGLESIFGGTATPQLPESEPQTKPAKKRPTKVTAKDFDGIDYTDPQECANWFKRNIGRTIERFKIEKDESVEGAYVIVDTARVKPGSDNYRYPKMTAPTRMRVVLHLLEQLIRHPGKPMQSIKKESWTDAFPSGQIYRTFKDEQIVNPMNDNNTHSNKWRILTKDEVAPKKGGDKAN